MQCLFWVRRSLNRAPAAYKCTECIIVKGSIRRRAQITNNPLDIGNSGPSWINHYCRVAEANYVIPVCQQIAKSKAVMNNWLQRIGIRKSVSNKSGQLAEESVNGIYHMRRQRHCAFEFRSSSIDWSRQQLWGVRRSELPKWETICQSGYLGKKIIAIYCKTMVKSHLTLDRFICCKWTSEISSFNRFKPILLRSYVICSFYFL